MGDSNGAKSDLSGKWGCLLCAKEKNVDTILSENRLETWIRERENNYLYRD
jgi:hypothetical protein